MELKLLWKKFLLTIFLHYQMRQNQKMTTESPFETTRWLFTWLLTLRQRMPHTSPFLNCFTLNHIFLTSCHFQIVRLSWFNSGANFGPKKLNSCSLDVLVFCREANHYSKIGCVLSKIKKNPAGPLWVNGTRVINGNAFINNHFT